MIVPHLIHGAGIGLLVGGGATALGVITASLIPQWPRIVRLALSHVEPAQRVSDAIPHLATDGGSRQPSQTGHPPMSPRSLCPLHTSQKGSIA
jgi:hypothetical protein